MSVSLLVSYPSLCSGVVGSTTLSRSKTLGYEAAESAFSPMQSLYVTPVLPHSSLLNSLPIASAELIGQIQGFLESFVQLRSPRNKRVLEQIGRDDSALWQNLRVNAQRATGMYVYNEGSLSPLLASNVDKEKYGVIVDRLSKNRAEYGLTYQNELKTLLISLVSESRRSKQAESVLLMYQCLTSLCNVASLQVPISEYLKPLTMPGVKLLGRATVKIKVAALGDERIRTMKVIVDGINYPLTGGNFIDLCRKKFYNKMSIREDKIENSDEKEDIYATVFGSFEYNDARNGKVRRIPLEVYREDKSRNRFTTMGSANNTAVFTSAKPVQSFATVSRKS